MLGNDCILLSFQYKKTTNYARSKNQITLVKNLRKNGKRKKKKKSEHLTDFIFKWFMYEALIEDQKTYTCPYQQHSLTCIQVNNNIQWTEMKLDFFIYIEKYLYKTMYVYNYMKAGS